MWNDKGVDPWGMGGGNRPPIFGLGGRISYYPPFLNIFNEILLFHNVNSTLFSVYCRHCLRLSYLIKIYYIFKLDHTGSHSLF